MKLRDILCSGKFENDVKKAVAVRCMGCMEGDNIPGSQVGQGTVVARVEAHSFTWLSE